jgi:ABC-2 type transport system permease protein
VRSAGSWFKVAEAIAVWRHLAGARIRADWQYRTSFFLFTLSQFLVTALDILVIVAIFTQVDSLGGWSVSEVALTYGLATLSFGLADLFVSPVETTSTHVKAGTFDLFLQRPVPALVQVCGTEFALRRLGKIAQPTIVLVIALVTAPIDWGPEAAVLLPVSVVSGTVIFSAVWVAATSIVFWTIDGQETANSFTYGGSLLAQYPLTLFPGVLRRLLTFVFPLAFVAFLPAARLLGRDQAIGVPSAVAWAGPPVAVAAALLAGGVWGIAIRHYRSTGS